MLSRGLFGIPYYRQRVFPAWIHPTKRQEIQKHDQQACRCAYCYRRKPQFLQKLSRQL